MSAGALTDFARVSIVFQSRCRKSRSRSTSSAEAPSAAVRTITPPCSGAISLRIAFRRLRSSSSSRRETPSPSPVRDVDDEAAGQRDLGRQAGALRLHRVLDRLDEDRLAALDQVLDLPGAAAALELGADDLVDVEEAVLLESDLDERGLHPRQDVVDGAEVDVAGDRAVLGPLEVDLGDDVVLEHGDALLAGVDRDDQLALRLRQRRAARRRAARRAGARALARALALAALGRGGQARPSAALPRPGTARGRRGHALAGLLLAPGSTAIAAAALPRGGGGRLSVGALSLGRLDGGQRFRLRRLPERLPATAPAPLPPCGGETREVANEISLNVRARSPA